MMWKISDKRIEFCAQVEGTGGEMFPVSPIALQSRCNSVPNEPIPTFGHSWPQQQSVRMKWKTDRARRKGETMLRGHYATQCVKLMPGMQYFATGVSLTPLMECVNSEAAIPPAQKSCFPYVVPSLADIPIGC